ncbi:Ribokinase-like protein [Umbelopsis sp. PMI_123]|nr:Ribokinase-like protein [Umbelopsis sp. PMI_123]
MSPPRDPILLSCGSLIIDDIKWEDGSEQTNVLGGAGVFAIYGARVWLEPPKSQQIGYTVQRGFDFVPEIQRELDRLNVSLYNKDHPDLHTPRGLNTFSPDDHRDFEYIHPVIRIYPRDFPPKWLLSAKIIHLICAAARAREIVDEWHTLQQKYAEEFNMPKSDIPDTMFMWEPLPWDCIAEKWNEFKDVMKMIDIVSPNHEEAAAVLGTSMDKLVAELGDPSSALAFLAEQFVQAGVGKHQQGCVAIRAGKRGAVVCRKDTPSWCVPAYWQPPEQCRIKDVTGAGNAFCGGFCYGYLQNKDIIEAAMYGSVSSSFAIEQVGVPRLDATEEIWNEGPPAVSRLIELQRRIVANNIPTSEAIWRST